MRSPELDRACFTSPLGVIDGPIETSYGWHLVLVEERIGCRFDEGMTRVVPGEAGSRAVLKPAEPAEAQDLVMPLLSTIATGVTALVLGQLLADFATSLPVPELPDAPTPAAEVSKPSVDLFYEGKGRNALP